MTVSEKAWIRYISRLRKVNDAAAEKMLAFLQAHDMMTMEGRKAVQDYAFALSTAYGEAASALSCAFYDAVAEASGIAVPAAEPAPTATYGEVAKTVNGTMKHTDSPEVVSQAVGRLVKMAGVDTTMKNAIRDGAEWAWIPHGDTCPFCITLASNGWQRASKKVMKGGHAEHIHANCDCTFAVRFDGGTRYEGYEPERYLAAYEDAEGMTPKDKINALRREQYARDKDHINEQKRLAYARRKETDEKTKQ